MTSDKAMISVVTPVYGCTDCLEALADAVRHALSETGLNWELIFVDDRGPDDPWSTICELSALDSRVRGVRLSRNHGQHLAIWAGLQASKGDWVAVIDCDLQDDPAIIPALLEQAKEDPELQAVVVERGKWKDSWFRRAASRFFYWFIDTLVGVRLNNNVGNFGIYSRRLVNILLQFREQEVFLPVMVALTSQKRGFYVLDRSDRAAGESSYNLLRLMRLAVAIIIRFSDRPLKLSVIVGLLFSTASAGFSVLILIAWSVNAFTVPGWTSIILSVWFLSGLILAVLGVHGFYLGRVFAEVQQRPRILIDCETISGEVVEFTPEPVQANRKW